MELFSIILLAALFVAFDLVVFRLVMVLLVVVAVGFLDFRLLLPETDVVFDSTSVALSLLLLFIVMQSLLLFIKTLLVGD